MSHKTTVYLPDDLKAAVTRSALQQGSSEAAVIRAAIAAAVSHPRPRAGFIDAEPFAERTDELLDGFGTR